MVVLATWACCCVVLDGVLTVLGGLAHCPREHGHAQGIVVASGLKMDRKDLVQTLT